MCFITVDTYRLGNINRFIATCSLGFCQLSRDRLTLVVPLFKLGMDFKVGWAIEQNPCSKCVPQVSTHGGNTIKKTSKSSRNVLGTWQCLRSHNVFKVRGPPMC